MVRVHVINAGLRTMLQDLGRPGLAHLGICPGGAWDRTALDRANALAGNTEEAACLETMLGGLQLKVEGGNALFAVAGARVTATVDDREVKTLHAILVHDGETLTIGQPTSGLRCYVAIRGGFEGKRSFGSLASDPTRGLGPDVVHGGDVLTIGDDAGRAHYTRAIYTRVRLEPPTPIGDLIELHAVWGPRDDWFTPESREAFASSLWEVTQEADRVGVRLSGPVLKRAIEGELQSEGTVRGSVQVPANGQPLVFGPDQPTTGGYPVIAVVDGVDADKLAQAAPGTKVQFIMRHEDYGQSLPRD